MRNDLPIIGLVYDCNGCCVGVVIDKMVGTHLMYNAKVIDNFWENITKIYFVIYCIFYFFRGDIRLEIRYFIIRDTYGTLICIKSALYIQTISQVGYDKRCLHSFFWKMYLSDYLETLAT